jgi:hypothetical protein
LIFDIDMFVTALDYRVDHNMQTTGYVSTTAEKKTMATICCCSINNDTWLTTVFLNDLSIDRNPQCKGSTQLENCGCQPQPLQSMGPSYHRQYVGLLHKKDAVSTRIDFLMGRQGFIPHDIMTKAQWL